MSPDAADSLAYGLYPSAAETIARALLCKPQSRDPNDPATWCPGFRALVARARDERIAELRADPGITSAEPDPDDPRGMRIMYAEPIRFFEIRLAQGKS